MIHALSSTHREMVSYNQALRDVVAQQGLTLLEYKVVKAVVEGIAIILVGYAMYLGTPPTFGVAAILSIFLGVEVLEGMWVGEQLNIIIEREGDEE